MKIVFEDTLTFERPQDSGTALVSENIENNSEPNLFVKIQSWDESKKHLLARSLEGKKIRVTIETEES